MLTRKEAAELLQVSESTVYRLFRTRQLGGYLIGSQIRFDERDIEEYMARSRREPLPPGDWRTPPTAGNGQTGTCACPAEKARQGKAAEGNRGDPGVLPWHEGGLSYEMA